MAVAVVVADVDCCWVDDSGGGGGGGGTGSGSPKAPAAMDGRWCIETDDA